MDKKDSYIFNCDSNNNDQNNYNNEEECLKPYNNSINFKDEGSNIQIDLRDTGISKEIKIDNNKVSDDNNPEPNLLGRKKKSSSKKKIHDKYSSDNVIKKIKSIILSCLLNFINNVIKSKYNDYIGHDIYINQLLKINKNEILSSKFNKPLLNTSLKDIFSKSYSTKYIKSYEEKHNENLIEKLLNEENEEKRLFFNQLFNLTFTDCLYHINGKYIAQLNGLDSLDKILEKFEDEEYRNYLKKFFGQFVEIIGRSRTKNTKKKKLY